MNENKIFSLMEKLASFDTWRGIEKDIFNEDFLFESDESRIRRIFGKITVPKELWHGVDDKNEKNEKKIIRLPIKFKPKYFTINSYRIKGLSSETVSSIFTGMNSIRLDQMLHLLHTISGKNFSVWKFSNLRMILKPTPAESNSSFIEIRYDRKLYLKSISHQEDAVAPEKVLKPSNKNDTRKFTSEEKQKAKKLGKEDVSKIQEKISFVRNNITNVYDVVEMEKCDRDKVSEDSGTSKAIVLESEKVSYNVYKTVEKVEPNITKEVVKAVSTFGGQMFGLPYRLKQPTSLAIKIAKDSIEFVQLSKLYKRYVKLLKECKKFASFAKDSSEYKEYENYKELVEKYKKYANANTLKTSVKAAGDDIKDAIRYTAVFPTERLADGYKQVKTYLLRKGYMEIRCKNFYSSYEKGDSQQKAIQSVFATPDKILFEFQFHTINSLGIKEINHDLYKNYGSETTSDEQKRILDLRMKYLSANIETPADVLKIKSYTLSNWEKDFDKRKR